MGKVPTVFEELILFPSSLADLVLRVAGRGTRRVSLRSRCEYCQVREASSVLTTQDSLADGKMSFPLVMVGGVLENEDGWDLREPLINIISREFPGAKPISPEVTCIASSSMSVRSNKDVRVGCYRYIDVLERGCDYQLRWMLPFQVEPAVGAAMVAWSQCMDLVETESHCNV